MFLCHLGQSKVNDQKRLFAIEMPHFGPNGWDSIALAGKKRFLESRSGQKKTSQNISFYLSRYIKPDSLFLLNAIHDGFQFGLFPQLTVGPTQRIKMQENRDLASQQTKKKQNNTKKVPTTTFNLT